MEQNKILHANLLDIVFDGRNKDYGAYDLRKSYNKRLATALTITGSVLLLFFLSSVLANAFGSKVIEPLQVKQEVILEQVPPKQNIPDEVKPPEQPKPEPAAPVDQTRFTPPEIVEDDKVNKDELAPVVEDLADSKISTVTVAGDPDPNIVAPPKETGTGEAIALTKPVEDYTSIFTRVEIEARFPGGADGWRRYLERNLQYPEAATDAGTEAVIRVQLVVDKAGNISDVIALNDPGQGLAEEAMRVIRKGPKWIPAEQNGQNVAYRFVQSITFRLQ